VNRTDTIIAPATPAGDGGLAVVRISGTAAKEAIHQFFIPSGKQKILESHHLYHGYLSNNIGQKVDEVMVVYMQHPRSYTCEDVVEIHCHGGQFVVKSILDLFLQYGLRLASPGEFTYRAFMNGRLDLAQAEAVSRLIHSRSESARIMALSQVDGQLSQAIYRFTSQLRSLLVLVEAWIDFPEEDLPEEQQQGIYSQLNDIMSQIATLLDTYQTGKILSEGATILLLGRPNVGKSSLLNALLGESRAIVTDIPGTTRDTLEEYLTIGGMPVKLIDTAGFRSTDDLVELEGVRRAKEKVASSDLVLFLVDGSHPPHREDDLAYQACVETKSLLVVTKSDLESQSDVSSFRKFDRVDISTKTGAGLESLREAILAQLIDHSVGDCESVALTEKRHRDALVHTRDFLRCAMDSLNVQSSLEFIALDIRGALDALGSISGETTPDDILNDIFSSFCIGK